MKTKQTTLKATDPQPGSILLNSDLEYIQGFYWLHNNLETY